MAADWFAKMFARDHWYGPRQDEAVASAMQESAGQAVGLGSIPVVRHIISTDPSGFKSGAGLVSPAPHIRLTKTITSTAVQRKAAHELVYESSCGLPHLGQPGSLEPKPASTVSQGPSKDFEYRIEVGP